MLKMSHIKKILALWLISHATLFAQPLSIPDKTVFFGEKFITRGVHLSSIESIQSNYWSYLVTYEYGKTTSEKKVVTSCSDLSRLELPNEAPLPSDLSIELKNTYPDTANREEISFVCQVVGLANSGNSNWRKLALEISDSINSKRDAIARENEKLAIERNENERIAALERERTRPPEQSIVFCVQTVEVSRTRSPSIHFQDCANACRQTFNQSMCSEVGGTKWRVQTASPKSAPADWQAYTGFGKCSCIGQEYVLNEVRDTILPTSSNSAKEADLAQREKALAEREKALLEAENKRLKDELERLKPKTNSSR